MQLTLRELLENPSGTISSYFYLENIKLLAATNKSLIIGRKVQRLSKDKLDNKFESSRVHGKLLAALMTLHFHQPCL